VTSACGDVNELRFDVDGNDAERLDYVHYE
jgi:hypothetical protein